MSAINPKKKFEYPYLPQGREILYVSEDNPFMARAKQIRNEWSTEKNHPTGAVVVFDGSIIGEAANRARIKNGRLINLHKKFCLRRFFHIKTGEKYWVCPGCAKLKDHAEVSAIRSAIKKGYSTEGADLYLYGHWWCCKPCWDSMIAGHIKDVYLLENSEVLFGNKVKK
jgi:deoxycytidylate deaminase